MDDLRKRLIKLKIAPWTFRHSDDVIFFEMKLRPYLIPKLSVKVNSELNYSITVFNWPLPDDHKIYKKHCRTLRNTFVSSLLKEIAEFCVCSGKKESMESSRVHSIPLEINEDDNNPYISEEIYLSKDCHALRRLEICDNCCKYGMIAPVTC